MNENTHFNRNVFIAEVSDTCDDRVDVTKSKMAHIRSHDDNSASVPGSETKNMADVSDNTRKSSSTPNESKECTDAPNTSKL